MPGAESQYNQKVHKHQENAESTSTRLGALGSAFSIDSYLETHRSTSNHELMPFSLTDLPFLYIERVMVVLGICWNLFNHTYHKTLEERIGALP